MRALALLAILLPGCALPVGHRGPLGAPIEPAAGWRNVVSPDDRRDLSEWRRRFGQALEAARDGGFGASLAADPVHGLDAALRGPAIPTGTYRCRTIKIGASQPGLLNYVAYGWFTCRVGVAKADGTQTLNKINGSQRQNGILYPNDDYRSVFLGTLALGDEQGALRYGQDRERDVAGWLERIGPRRWRIMMPAPRYESQTDLLELIPAA